MAPSDEVHKRRVLVTRPAGQAQGLCAMLEAAGYRTYHQPLLELQALPELPAPQRQWVLELDRYQHIVFISGNAVHFGMACIEDYWPQLPVGLTWYAIGESTAAQLASRGVAAVTPGAAMTSEGLLAVEQLQSVTGQRILIVKGEGGRATLREELTRRGARVEELACYRRCAPDLAPGELAARLGGWHIEVALISSGEGLSNLLALLSVPETTKFKDISLIVPSQRVAAMAHEAGFEQVATAANASDGAMLRALQEWKPGE
jgi:uroporphyrinogen-III synthase